MVERSMMGERLPTSENSDSEEDSKLSVLLRLITFPIVRFCHELRHLERIRLDSRPDYLTQLRLS